MHGQDKKALFFELADALLQSWWTVVAGICLGVTGALVALAMTDSWYLATARIYVTPELSREITQPVVADDMLRRMAGLQDAVLSDRHIRRMVEEIYGPVESEQTLGLRMSRVRKRIDPPRPTALGPQSGPEALYAFDLTYRDTKPERAAQAANLLAELYIEQNKEFRTKQSQDTARAAEEQAARAKEEFDRIDNKVIEFREQHRFETGDHQDANLRLMDRRQEELRTAQERRRVLENQITDLGTRLTEVEAGASSGATTVIALRRELEQLLTQYSEEHPRVILQRRKLQEALDAQGASAEAPVGDPTYPADPQAAVVRGQIESARRELAALDQHEAELRRDIGVFERRLATVPHVQPQLSRLETEHGMLKQQYEKLRATADQASQALFLEQALRGESFELAARAGIPQKRYYPDPKRFYMIGILGGCLIFVGPLLAMRFLNPVISSEAGLRALTDVPVLVALPRIETPTTEGYHFRRRMKNVALSTLCTAVTVTAFIFLG